MKILVKDSEWYREAYNMPCKVKVYVNETRAEHMAEEKRQEARYNENRIMGYAGFDEDHIDHPVEVLTEDF